MMCLFLDGVAFTLTVCGRPLGTFDNQALPCFHLRGRNSSLKAPFVVCRALMSIGLVQDIRNSGAIEFVPGSPSCSKYLLGQSKIWRMAEEGGGGR